MKGTKCSTGDASVQLIWQNFSKFLVKDGKIKWFPARTTKVVCISSLSLRVWMEMYTPRSQGGGRAVWDDRADEQSDVEAAL